MNEREAVDCLHLPDKKVDLEHRYWVKTLAYDKEKFEKMDSFHIHADMYYCVICVKFDRGGRLRPDQVKDRCEKYARLPEVKILPHEERPVALKAKVLEMEKEGAITGVVRMGCFWDGRNWAPFPPLPPLPPAEVRGGFRRVLDRFRSKLSRKTEA